MCGLKHVDTGTWHGVNKAPECEYDHGCWVLKSCHYFPVHVRTIASFCCTISGFFYSPILIFFIDYMNPFSKFNCMSGYLIPLDITFFII